MNISENLKTIGGVLLIEVQGEAKLVCMEDLQKSKVFSTGQIFNAIRVLNDKTVHQYGKLWINYRNDDGEISNDWKTIEAVRGNCNSDWDFIVEVCNQLKEEVPQIIERKKVQEQLEMFRQGLVL